MTKQRRRIDPWETAGPAGTWGRPDIIQKPRQVNMEEILERAVRALNNGSDAKFRNIAARFSRLFDW